MAPKMKNIQYTCQFCSGMKCMLDKPDVCILDKPDVCTYSLQWNPLHNCVMDISMFTTSKVSDEIVESITILSDYEQGPFGVSRSLYPDWSWQFSDVS